MRSIVEIQTIVLHPGHMGLTSSRRLMRAGNRAAVPLIPRPSNEEFLQVAERGEFKQHLI